jgi:hypothetical protein
LISAKVILTIIMPIFFIIIGITTVVQQPLQQVHSAETVHLFNEAPIITSDGNAYVTWWSNKTGNDEVLFRASNDNGLTFGDKINLSNTTTSESVDAMIDADGDTVVVTWWERNNTSNEPVLRISNDAGQTFGPLLQLSHNGTLGSTDDSEEGQ